MKKILFIILICSLSGYAAKRLTHGNDSKQHVFLFQDNDISKFYLVDSVKNAYKTETIINSPVIAIDGIVFQYNKENDTIYLPIKKLDISTIDFVNKDSSPIIYGKNETNGAIIINTVSLR